MLYLQKKPQNFNDLFLKNLLNVKHSLTLASLMVPIFGSFHSEAFIGLDIQDD